MTLAVKNLEKDDLNLTDLIDQKLGPFTSSNHPVGYFAKNKNPILEVLTHQLNDIQQGARIAYAGSDLLHDILKALDEKKLAWPNNFQLLKREDWIEKMKTNPTFYMYSAKDGNEMKIHEDLILNLATNLLKKTINLLPILDGDLKITFQPLVVVDSTDKLSIGYCNRLFQRNFFICAISKC